MRHDAVRDAALGEWVARLREPSRGPGGRTVPASDSDVPDATDAPDAVTVDDADDVPFDDADDVPFDDPYDEPGWDEPPPGPAAWSPWTVGRTGLTRAVLAVQLVAVPVLALLGRRDGALVVAAVALPTVLLMSVRLGGRTLPQWRSVWTAWRGRAAAAHAEERAGTGAETLLRISPGLRLGGISAPHGSEIGLLVGDEGWTCALWVGDGDRAHVDGHDPLDRILALRPPASPAVGLRAVLQQSYPAHEDTAELLTSGWLVLDVNPLRSLAPRTAVGAVPSLLRSETRSLLQQTADGAIRLVALDRGDLAAALGATVELPWRRPRHDDGLHETWRHWHAAGRVHHAFALRAPDLLSLRSAVGAALDAAARQPGTTSTVSVHYPAPPQDERRGVVRVSHPSRSVLDEVVSRLRADLAAIDVDLVGLGGRQVPALLDTSVLVGHA